MINKKIRDRFKKLAGLINEQLDPIKDVGSGCADKTQIELGVFFLSVIC